MLNYKLVTITFMFGIFIGFAFGGVVGFIAYKINNVTDVELRSENCEGGKGGFVNEIMWNQDIYLNGELLPKPYNFQCIK